MAIQGIDRVRRNLRVAVENIAEGRSERAIYEILSQGAAMAQTMTPIDTSNLINSQTAPSGASRSFRYQAFADRWKAQLALLNALDKDGCATGLIPPNPTQTAHGGLWIARGGCMCGDS